MNDQIYSDWILDILRKLSEDQSNLKHAYASWDILEKVLRLNADARKRAMKQKGGRAFPNYWEPYENIYSALVKIGIEFDCPKSMVESCIGYLGEKGVSIPYLSELISEMGSIEGGGERWTRDFDDRTLAFGLPRHMVSNDDFSTRVDADASELNDDEKAIVSACDAIATRCRKDASPAQTQPTSPPCRGPRVEPSFSLVLAILSGRSEGRPSFSFLDDGLGPVDYELPRTPGKLAALVLDERMLGSVDWIAGVDNLEEAAGLRRSATEWFSSDSAHRFSTMVGRCRNLLTQACDDEIVAERTRRAFDAIAESSPRRDAVIGTKSLVFRYANGDAPRILAATVLAFLVGVERSDYISSIVR